MHFERFELMEKRAQEMTRYKLQLAARKAKVAELRLILEFAPDDEDARAELLKLARTPAPTIPESLNGEASIEAI